VDVIDSIIILPQFSTHASDLMLFCIVGRALEKLFLLSPPGSYSEQFVEDVGTEMFPRSMILPPLFQKKSNDLFKRSSFRSQSYKGFFSCSIDLNCSFTRGICSFVRTFIYYHHYNCYR